MFFNVVTQEVNEKYDALLPNKMAGIRRDSNHEKLSKDHLSNEIELNDRLHQVKLCMKRNVVEMFSSLEAKIHLCDVLSLVVEDSYLYIISYLSKERHVIRVNFNRDEYDNDISLKHQLGMNGSLLYIKEQIEHLKEYSGAKAAVFDEYEDELKSEYYGMTDATSLACDEYFTTLQEMIRRADAIVKILRKLEKKTVETRNAIVAFNMHLIHFYNEKKEAGKSEEIRAREVTRIIIFGDEGEIYNAKFKHEDAKAKLVFYRVDLHLETIVGIDEE